MRGRRLFVDWDGCDQSTGYHRFEQQLILIILESYIMVNLSTIKVC